LGDRGRGEPRLLGVPRGEERNRGKPKDDVVVFCLRLKVILEYSLSLAIECQEQTTYRSGKSRSSGSSASNASSLLWSSSTAGCFPFDMRLDDASACPSGDCFDGDLDIPSTCTVEQYPVHSLSVHSGKVSSILIR
jgi:hypothetical protein